MVLVDTSIWIDHLHLNNPDLQILLDERQVLTHPLIIGETAVGSLNQRAKILKALKRLTTSSIADDDDVLSFIERYALFGTGVGYIDVHLLASMRLTPEALLWTRDRRMIPAAERLEIATKQTA